MLIRPNNDTTRPRAKIKHHSQLSSLLRKDFLLHNHSLHVLFIALLFPFLVLIFFLAQPSNVVLGPYIPAEPYPVYNPENEYFPTGGYQMLPKIGPSSLCATLQSHQKRFLIVVYPLGNFVNQFEQLLGDFILKPPSSSSSPPPQTNNNTTNHTLESLLLLLNQDKNNISDDLPPIIILPVDDLESFNKHLADGVGVMGIKWDQNYLSHIDEDNNYPHYNIDQYIFEIIPGPDEDTILFQSPVLFSPFSTGLDISPKDNLLETPHLGTLSQQLTMIHELLQLTTAQLNGFKSTLTLCDFIPSAFVINPIPLPTTSQHATNPEISKTVVTIMSIWLLLFSIYFLVVVGEIVHSKLHHNLAALIVLKITPSRIHLSTLISHTIVTIPTSLLTTLAICILLRTTVFLPIFIWIQLIMINIITFAQLVSTPFGSFLPAQIGSFVTFILYVAVSGIVAAYRPPFLPLFEMLSFPTTICRTAHALFYMATHQGIHWSTMIDFTMVMPFQQYSIVHLMIFQILVSIFQFSLMVYLDQIIPSSSYRISLGFLQPFTNLIWAPLQVNVADVLYHQGQPLISFPTIPSKNEPPTLNNPLQNNGTYHPPQLFISLPSTSAAAEAVTSAFDTNNDNNDGANDDGEGDIFLSDDSHMGDVQSIMDSYTSINSSYTPNIDSNTNTSTPQKHSNIQIKNNRQHPIPSGIINTKINNNTAHNFNSNYCHQIGQNSPHSSSLSSTINNIQHLDHHQQQQQQPLSLSQPIPISFHYKPSSDIDPDYANEMFPPGSVYLRLFGLRSDELFPWEEWLYTGVDPPSEIKISPPNPAIQEQQQQQLLVGTTTTNANNSHNNRRNKLPSPSELAQASSLQVPIIPPLSFTHRAKIQPPNHYEQNNPSITIKHLSKLYDANDKYRTSMNTMGISKEEQQLRNELLLSNNIHRNNNDNNNSNDVFESLQSSAAAPQHWALRDVNLRCYRGQIMTILGRNSSGKSTLLNIIGGAVPHTSGSLFIHPPKDDNETMCEYQPSYGFCWQDDYLFPTLTVRENIEVFSSLKLATMQKSAQITKEMEMQEIDRVLTMAKLTEQFDNKETTLIGNLSGGQRRKLCVAVALLHHPDIILLDSPTVGADVTSQATIAEMLHASKANKTIIISTLNFQEAQIGDRISILKDGMIECSGTNTWLKEQYNIGDYLITIDKQNQEEAQTIPLSTLPPSLQAKISTIQQKRRQGDIISPLVSQTSPLGSSSAFNNHSIINTRDVNHTRTNSAQEFTPTSALINAMNPDGDRINNSQSFSPRPPSGSTSPRSSDFQQFDMRNVSFQRTPSSARLQLSQKHQNQPQLSSSPRWTSTTPDNNNNNQGSQCNLFSSNNTSDHITTTSSHNNGDLNSSAGSSNLYSSSTSPKSPQHTTNFLLSFSHQLDHTSNNHNISIKNNPNDGNGNNDNNSPLLLEQSYVAQVTLPSDTPLHERLMALPPCIDGSIYLSDILTRSAETQSSISYSILPQWSDHVPEVLQFLDDNKTALGISTLSLSLLTLEHVFQAVHQKNLTIFSTDNQLSPHNTTINNTNIGMTTSLSKSQPSLTQEYKNDNINDDDDNNYSYQALNDNDNLFHHQQPSNFPAIVTPIDYTPWYERKYQKLIGPRLFLIQTRYYALKRIQILWNNKISSILPAVLLLLSFFGILFFLTKMKFPPSDPVTIGFDFYPKNIPYTVIMPPKRHAKSSLYDQLFNFDHDSNIIPKTIQPNYQNNNDNDLNINLTPSEYINMQPAQQNDPDVNIYGDLYDQYDVADWFFSLFLDTFHLKKSYIELPLRVYNQHRYSATDSIAQLLITEHAAKFDRLSPHQIGFELTSLGISYNDQNHIQLFGAIPRNVNGTIDKDINISTLPNYRDFSYRYDRTNDNMTTSINKIDSLGDENNQQNNTTALPESVGLGMCYPNNINPKDRRIGLTTLNMNFYYNTTTPYNLQSFVERYYLHAVFLERCMPRFLSQSQQQQLGLTNSSLNDFKHNNNNDTIFSTTTLSTNDKKHNNDHIRNNKPTQTQPQFDTTKPRLPITTLMAETTYQSRTQIILNSPTVLLVVFNLITFFVYFALCIAIIVFLHNEETASVTHLHHLMGGKLSRVTYWVGYFVSDVWSMLIALITAISVAELMVFISDIDTAHKSTNLIIIGSWVERLYRFGVVLLIVLLISASTAALLYILSILFPKSFLLQLAIFALYHIISIWAIITTRSDEGLKSVSTTALSYLTPTAIVQNTNAMDMIKAISLTSGLSGFEPLFDSLFQLYERSFDYVTKKIVLSYPIFHLLSATANCQWRFISHRVCYSPSFGMQFWSPLPTTAWLLVQPTLLLIILYYRHYYSHYYNATAFDGTTTCGLLNTQTGSLSSASRWFAKITTAAAALAPFQHIANFVRAELITRPSAVVRHVITKRAGVNLKDSIDQNDGFVQITARNLTQLSHSVYTNPNVAAMKRDIISGGYKRYSGNNTPDNSSRNHEETNAITFYGIRKVYTTPLSYIFIIKSFFNTIFQTIFPFIADCFKHSKQQRSWVGQQQRFFKLKMLKQREALEQAWLSQSNIIPTLWDRTDDLMFYQCLSNLDYVHMIHEQLQLHYQKTACTTTTFNNQNNQQTGNNTNTGSPLIDNAAFSNALFESQNQLQSKSSINGFSSHSSGPSQTLYQSLGSSVVTNGVGSEHNGTSTIFQKSASFDTHGPTKLLSSFASTLSSLTQSSRRGLEPLNEKNTEKLNPKSQQQHQEPLLETHHQQQQQPFNTRTTSSPFFSDQNFNPFAISQQTFAERRQHLRMTLLGDDFELDSDSDDDSPHDENDTDISKMTSESTPHQNKGVVALNELYLSIKKNTVTAISGHNGAGKSSILQILTAETAISPSLDILSGTGSSGTVFIGDANLTTNPTAMCTRISYCPQYDRLNLELSARQTFQLYSALCGLDIENSSEYNHGQDDLDTYINEILYDLGLSKVADQPCATYTADQRRLVTIGISLLGQQEIVVLDEPTAYSDAVSRKRVHNLLQSLTHTRTLIFTSHMIEEVDFLADEIAVLTNGSLQIVGPKSLLKDGRALVLGDHKSNPLTTSDNNMIGPLPPQNNMPLSTSRSTTGSSNNSTSWSDHNDSIPTPRRQVLIMSQSSNHVQFDPCTSVALYASIFEAIPEGDEELMSSNDGSIDNLTTTHPTGHQYDIFQPPASIHNNPLLSSSLANVPNPFTTQSSSTLFHSTSLSNTPRHHIFPSSFVINLKPYKLQQRQLQPLFALTTHAHDVISQCLETQKHHTNETVNSASNSDTTGINNPADPRNRIKQLTHTVSIHVVNLQAALYIQAYVLAVLAEVPLPPFLAQIHQEFKKCTFNDHPQIHSSNPTPTNDTFTDHYLKQTIQGSPDESVSSLNGHGSYLQLPVSNLIAASVLNRSADDIQDELVQWITFLKMCELKGVILNKPTQSTTTPSVSTTFLSSVHHSVPVKSGLVVVDDEKSDQHKIDEDEFVTVNLSNNNDMGNKNRTDNNDTITSRWYNESIQFAMATPSSVTPYINKANHHHVKVQVSPMTDGLNNTTRDFLGSSSANIVENTSPQTHLTQQSTQFSILLRVDKIQLVRLFRLLQQCKQHCNGLLVKYVAQQPTLTQLFTNALTK